MDTTCVRMCNALLLCCATADNTLAHALHGPTVKALTGTPILKEGGCAYCDAPMPTCTQDDGESPISRMAETYRQTSVLLGIVEFPDARKPRCPFCKTLSDYRGYPAFFGTFSQKPKPRESPEPPNGALPDGPRVPYSPFSPVKKDFVHYLRARKPIWCLGETCCYGMQSYCTTVHVSLQASHPTM